MLGLIVWQVGALKFAAFTLVLIWRLKISQYAVCVLAQGAARVAERG